LVQRKGGERRDFNDGEGDILIKFIFGSKEGKKMNFN
jgi:hypothetical protein